MLIYSNFNNNRSGGGVGCLVFGILGMIAAFYILKGLFSLLVWAAPVLFVLALIINWKAVASVGKDFLSLLERNPLTGLLVGALAVVGFPVLSLYLFLKALGYAKADQVKPNFNRPATQQEPLEEFTDFEELESRPKSVPTTPEPIIKEQEMPEVKQEKTTPAPPPRNPYEDLFKG